MRRGLERLIVQEIVVKKVNRCQSFQSFDIFIKTVDNSNLYIYIYIYDNFFATIGHSCLDLILSSIHHHQISYERSVVFQ